jgi:hypothetical protein
VEVRKTWPKRPTQKAAAASRGTAVSVFMPWLLEAQGFSGTELR